MRATHCQARSLDIEIPTTDLTDLLEEVPEEDIEVEIELVDDLDPPTEDIENFLVEESPEESQQRPRLRRSWIAMPPSNTNARQLQDLDEPTRSRPRRGPLPSLPRFPILPPGARATASASPLPSFPLLPPEPRRAVPKAPPLRLPRFSLHDGRIA